MKGGSPFQRWAVKQWKLKYGELPPWGKAEMVCLQRGLNRLKREDRAKMAWDAYLAKDDEFHRGHDPKKWIFSLSRWSTTTPEKVRQEQQRKVEDRYLRLVQAGFEPMQAMKRANEEYR